MQPTGNRTISLPGSNDGTFAASLLYGVKPGDPLTLSLTGVLLVAAGLASRIPARRVASNAPLDALRTE